MIRDTLGATVSSAENTRRYISRLRASQAFDEAKLQAGITHTLNYRDTTIYDTVPVVSAWKSIAAIASEKGYEFRVPAHHPRNPTNVPRPDEERILNILENTKAQDFFEVNERANQVVYARPIVLTADCLLCHGDPATSPTKNANDMLGFRMEGWHEGDRHGAFVLRASLAAVDQQAQASLGRTAAWILPLSLVIGIGVYWLMSRLSNRLLDPVQGVSDRAIQIRDSLSQIASASQALAQSVSDHASFLQDTSLSSRTIIDLTHRNAQDTQAAAREMELVDTRIHESNTALEQMSASMSEIRASSDKISKIIQVIDEIAFQTNSLALNAAVEAARAGDAGAGFSVVADEVRSLAQRSAQAAKDTAPLIEESIARSNAGAQQLAEVTEVIYSVTESAAKVKALVDQVNLGSKEQARGIEQVSKAIDLMSSVTSTSAATSEDSAAATQDLSTQTVALESIAEQLRQIVEG